MPCPKVLNPESVFNLRLSAKIRVPNRAKFMPKSLIQLLAPLPAADIVRVDGDIGATITAPVVETDRDLSTGGLFVARKGLSVDGHDFIPRAIENGATAVVGEQEISGLSVPYVQVRDAQAAMGLLAAAYYDFPSRKLAVVGVTGTDGKTTTCHLIHSILKAAGFRAGFISTIEADFGGDSIPTGLHVTTPGAPQVQEYLWQMVNAGLTHCVLEMTSHGLAQGRLNGIDIDIAVLTNVTHEHLDYHGSWEEYRAAKATMFEILDRSYRKPEQPKFAIINADDPSADFFAAIPADKTMFYGIQPGDTGKIMEQSEPPSPALPPSTREGGQSTSQTGRKSLPASGEGFREGSDGKNRDKNNDPTILFGDQHTSSKYIATDIQHHPDSMRFEVGGESLAINLVGEFNVLNALAAVVTARGLGVNYDAIRAGLAEVKAIPGRMERINEGQNFTVIVDFAHTPNALKRALEAGRAMLPEGRLIAVFGSAGLRDVEKRRMMAETSAELADFTVLTAEDPRTESLDDILQMMAEGCISRGGVEGETFIRIPDRGEAVYRACQMAQSGDMVMVCGKGHEQSMCFGAIEYHWDDRDATRAALRGKPLRTLPTARDDE